MDAVIGRQARRARRRAAASCAQRRVQAPAPRRTRTPAEATCRPAPTSPPTTRCRRRRSGATGSSRASRWPTTPPARRAGAPSWASGGCKPARGGDGPVVRGAGRDRGPAAAADWLDRLQTEGLLEAAVVYGYFPCVSQGRRPDRARRRRHRADPLHLPAPAPRPAPVPGRLLPAARSPARPTWSRFQVVTMGTRISEVDRRAVRRRTPTATTWSCTACRCSSTEALAEYWHARVRAELGFGGEDPDDVEDMLRAQATAAPLLLRLPGLPRPGGPRQDRRAARAGADRRRAVRGVPAAPRAVDRRDRRPPPRGEVLQRTMSGARAAVLFDMDGTAGRLRAGLVRGAAGAGALARRRRCPDRPGAATLGTNVAGVGRHRARATSAGRTPTRSPAARKLIAEAASGSPPGWSWRPGARELVDAVRAAGIPTALVTATERPLVELALGPLGRRAASTCRSAATRSSTPSRHPDPYLAAAAAARRRPGRRRGDRGLPDRRGAAVRAAGCPVLVRSRAGDRTGPGRSAAGARDLARGHPVADLAALVAPRPPDATPPAATAVRAARRRAAPVDRPASYRRSGQSSRSPAGR